MKPSREQFILAFSGMMEIFGDSYLREHGEEVDGRHLVSALIRWAAATIAAAPPPERAQLLVEAIRQLHADMDWAEHKSHRRLN